MARIPIELTHCPFTLEQARMHGLTEDHLRGTSWKRIDRGVFAWHEIADQRMTRLRAALLRLPEGAVFSGATAGWLHGLDAELREPIEVTIPTARRANRRAGMLVHRSASMETSFARGLPVTSRVRTAVDLARRSSLIDAVAILDLALHRRLVILADVDRWVATNSAQRGIAVLRRALELAEPASESPMETRLRMLLVLAGFPRPRVQPTLSDQSGIFIARPDLFYPAHRLVIEYDGATHKDSIVADNRRQNRLYAAGYQVLRFSAGDVIGNPSGIVDLVRRALARPV